LARTLLEKAMMPAIWNMLCRLSEYQEGSRKFGRDHLVEGGQSPLAIGKSGMMPATVNHHIGSAESVYRLFEEPLHVCGNRHILLAQRWPVRLQP